MGCYIIRKQVFAASFRARYCVGMSRLGLRLGLNALVDNLPTAAKTGLVY